MATNVPPHNLRELIDAIVLVIREPDCTLDDLLEKLPGPDFPTGASICGSEGIRAAYATGRGLLTVRARAAFEESKRGPRIVVTEIPFMVNKAMLLERIAELVREGKIDGVLDLRDESNRQGMRIVIELRRDAPDDVILNQLYKQTPLQIDLRREPAGAGQRPPAAALAQGGDPALRRLPPRGGGAPRHLRPRPGRGARPPARGLRDRARAPRRGDPDHPRRRRHRRGAQRS